MTGYRELAELVTFRPLDGPVIGAGRGDRRSPFRASWSNTVSDLAGELRAIGARRVVLELDVAEGELRLDGLPRASARPASATVRLSFEATGVEGSPRLSYTVATFTTWQDNVRAIALGLRALRAVDRYGVTRRGEQYAGWKQLAAGNGDRSDVDRGRQIISREGSVAAALHATHPDTREPGGWYTDADFRAVRAAQQAAGARA